MDQTEALADMALFVHIVERGSLSAAGRALGLPKASVSRRLAAMERRAGAPLLNRSTRALSPTDLGRRFFDRVAPIVRDAALAQAELLAEQGAPTGLIRIAASVGFGRAVIAPRLFAFLAAHRAVRIDLRLSDARINLVADGFDLAIRMGDLDDSDLMARRLASVPMRLVAAPGYAALNGLPMSPDDLAQHRAILTRTDLDHWPVGERSIRLLWCISTGDMAVTRDAALAGLGIARLPAFLADTDIAAGNLIEVLPDHPSASVGVSAVYPRHVAMSPAIAALLRHLAD